jgi:hypothetical protein
MLGMACPTGLFVARVKTLFSPIPVFTGTLDLEFSKKLVKCYVWSIAYGGETWTLRAVD